MGIFGRLMRYVRTYGCPFYTDPGSAARESRRVARRRRGQELMAKCRYLEAMEPRVLLTTLTGGETFQFTDARGKLTTAQVNGNAVVELVSALQTGSGALQFGDIAGTYTGGPRTGLTIGDGVVPFLGRVTITDRTVNPAVVRTFIAPPPGDPGYTDQTNIQGISSSFAGQAFAFNLYDVDTGGAQIIGTNPANDTTQTAALLWQLDVISLNDPTTGLVTNNAQVLVHRQANDRFTGGNGPLVTGNLPMIQPGAGNVAIPAAAYNPFDGNVYFELHYDYTSTASGNNTVVVVDEMCRYNTGSRTISDMGRVTGTPGEMVRGMAFTINAATQPATGTMWMVEQSPVGAAVPNARLLNFAVSNAGVFNPGAPGGIRNLTLAGAPLRGVWGLSAVPGGVGNGILYATVGPGDNALFPQPLTLQNGPSTAQLVAISTATGVGTVVGATAPPGAVPPVDGQALVGLTYVRQIGNQFTNSNGGLLSIDWITGDLVLLNSSLRVAAGDVYAVYTTQGDINASVVFQGAGNVAGDPTPPTPPVPGPYHGLAPTSLAGAPSNTGTAFLGFIDTVATSSILTGQITTAIGMMPQLILDTTDPTAPLTFTNKLFAGLTVGRTLEETYITDPSLTLPEKELGDAASLFGAAFNHVGAMAVANDGTIVVVNNNGLTAPGELGIVDPATGKIEPASVGFITNGTQPLFDIEALAFGDVSLTGAKVLYAVYDTGTGPRLGTINLTMNPVTGSYAFTGITALGFNSSARVTAIAFTPGGTASDSKHEALYVIADPNAFDNDPTETLYQARVNAISGTIGTVLNPPTYDPVLGILQLSPIGVPLTGGIGQILDPTGFVPFISSATFDATGRMIVADHNSGRLMDVNLTNGSAGHFVETLAGTINATVAGVVFDPATLQFLAVDNMTGSSVGGVGATNTYAILMRIDDFSNLVGNPVNLGKFLFDGTVTGKTYVSGSMDIFYAGWNLDGDATVGAPGGPLSWVVPTTLMGSDGTGIDSAAQENNMHDNFYVGGDIRAVLALTDIGTSGNDTTGAPGFITNTEIVAGGKIGLVWTPGNFNTNNVFIAGSFAGVVHAGNADNVSNLVDSTPLIGFGDGSFAGLPALAYVVNGSATVQPGDIVDLTTRDPDQVGSIFAAKRQPIDAFNAAFTYQADAGLTGIDGGFAFVLENDPRSTRVMGGNGTSLGYSGITPSAALEFNLDPATGGSSMGLQTNGNIGYTPIPGIDIASGHAIIVAMSYSGTTLLVSLEDSTTGATFSKSFTIDLASVLNSHGAFVGFTGASSSDGSLQEISNFQYLGVDGGKVALPQGDLQHYIGDTDFPSFLDGFLIDTPAQPPPINTGPVVAEAPFAHNSFATAQYLGSIRNAITGQPDVIHVEGTIEGVSVVNRLNNPVDYWGFSLLAGQTVQVLVTPRNDPASLSAFALSTNFGIFDPDGRVIATDFSDIDPTQVQGRTIQFTADRPGVFRVAVQESGGTGTFAGVSGNNVSYDLTVTGIGDLAIGGVVAGAQINLEGSLWVTNSTENSGSRVFNPSIMADTGDVGAVVAGTRPNGTIIPGGTTAINGSILGPIASAGLAVLHGASRGLEFTGDSSGDITVLNGNLRALVGSQIGLFSISGPPVTISLSAIPDIRVSGDVGLISTPAGSGMLACDFSKAAGGNIQVISSGGDIEGVFQANGAIGIIRGNSVSDVLVPTEFHADEDMTGHDGFIDLIDVEQVAGTNATDPSWGEFMAVIPGTTTSAIFISSGAPIITGPGGDVRFMQVAGVIRQDTFFGGNPSGVGPAGGILHPAGPLTFTDDSGSKITLTPGQVATNATSGPLTTIGQLTTRVYGVRSGGVIVADVVSTSGLTVNVDAGGLGRFGEIGTITTGGTGVPLILINGLPSLPPTSATANANATTSIITNDVIIQSSGNARADVFHVIVGGATTNTLDTLSNSSPGDIVDVTANNVGVIDFKGNIGTTFSSTGAALNPIAVFNNAYPFVQQHTGLSLGNVGAIRAGGSVGNILVSGGNIVDNASNVANGVVGSITANADGVDNQNVFEGINGPIVINGTSVNTSNSVAALQIISLGQVNIGEGIATSGRGSMSQAGVYAVGVIQSVNGNNADIRGTVQSQRAIGSISLNNGSVINAHIAVLSSYVSTSVLNTAGITFPDFTTFPEQPVYNIDSININGNGGIIGTIIDAENTRLVNVSSSGFGILNSVIEGFGTGTINTVSTGGLGIRDVIMVDANVLKIAATGTGAPGVFASYSPTVRFSEHNFIVPGTSDAPSRLNDIEVFINGDGIVAPIDPLGTTTGEIENLIALGQGRIGDVSSYDLLGSSFAFPLSAGTFAFRHDAMGSQVVTGSVKSLTVAGDAINLEFTAAGKIGNVKIGGSQLTSTDPSLSTITLLSQIWAKGPSGTIASVTIGGDLGGTILADSNIPGAITVGGNFYGNIFIGANRLPGTALGALKLLGSITDGTITILGNATTIDIAHDFAGLASDLTVDGNLSNFLVGSDPLTDGSVFSARAQVTGNLNNMNISGAMPGTLVVKGNVGQFKVTSDAATAGTDVMSGCFIVGGSLNSMTVTGGSLAGTVDAGAINSAAVTGDLSGRIVGGAGVKSATITGNLLAGGEVTSALGDVSKLTISGGDLDGTVTAPNGAVGLSLAGTASIGAGATILARSMPTLTVPGVLAGNVTVNGPMTSVKATSIDATAHITATGLASLTTVGDMLGVLDIGNAPLANKLTIGGNLGGNSSFGGPVSATVAGDILPGAMLATTGDLTSLAVKGAIHGAVLADRNLGTVTAASLGNAVITAGLGAGSITTPGNVTNSLINIGLGRGGDGVFGTGDQGEQPRMADLNSLSVGAMGDSVVAAGGNITNFKSTGNVTDSSVSSGLVLSGNAIAAVLADGAPLSTGGKQNAARQGTTLLHGNMTSGTVGTGNGTTLFNSSLTAGVSPGADGAFGTADDNVNSSLTGGNSAFKTLKASPDGSSHFLADTGGTGITAVDYTLDGSAASIVQSDPVVGPPTAIATPGSPAIITTGNGTITVNVTGSTGAVVMVFDNPATTDRVDTLVISNTGTASAPMTVSVSTSAPDDFDLGRVLTTDGTQVASFTFNGDLLGDAAGGPALWIDSDMAKFSVRNLPDDAGWHGQIGGNVTTLTIHQLGPGQLRIGGRVNTGNIVSSVGNPLLEQLGTVNPPANIVQMAYNPLTTKVFASDGSNLLGVDVNTGLVSSNVPVHTFLGNQALNVSGLSFDNLGQLFSVSTINNQNPYTRVGAITTTGDHLHALAVNSAGQIFAVDTIPVPGNTTSSLDTLVQIDPTTGAETVVAAIRDPRGDTYTNNILALAFDNNDNLLALVNDRDGNGGVNSTSSGVALAVLATADPQNLGYVTLSNPTPGSTGLMPVLLTGTIQGNFTGLSVDAVGNIFAVRHVGSSDELDRLAIAGAGAAATVTLTSKGNIKLDGGATDTQIVGMGFDENGSLIALNTAGARRELIAISTSVPGTASVRLDSPGLVPTSLASFAIGKSGAVFKTYGYTTDPNVGGSLYTNPGVVATLGVIGTSGVNAGRFTQLLPLAQDSSGTALADHALSVAADAAGHVFVLTDGGILAEYSSLDGALIGGAPLGVVTDQNGAPLSLTQIAFDASGRLVGLNASGNDLVVINPATTVINGENVVIAHDLTALGTVNAADLTALTFLPAIGRFVSYSKAQASFMSILGTTPDALGGLVANSLDAINLTAGFAGRIFATGNGTGTGIGTVKLSGNGTVGGYIGSDGAIGSVSGTGVDFSGTLVSGADLNSLVLTGNITAGATVAAQGSLKTLTLNGDLGGDIICGTVNSLTVNGATLADSLIKVRGDAGALTITKQAAGTVLGGGRVQSLRVGGLLASGASISIAGDAGSIALSGGTDDGSLLIVNQGVGSLNVAATLAGTIAVRRSVSSASIAGANVGLLDIGGNLNSLNINGAFKDSLVSVGTWIGPDGVFNTADDVIFGGSISSARVGGAFTDSVIAAGVLPRQGVVAGDNNVPIDNRAYTGNASAEHVEDVDSAESGGIVPSVIQNISFSKQATSTAPIAGLVSAVVAADGLGKVNGPAAVQRIVRNDPLGSPKVVTSVDPLTLVESSEVTRFSPGEVRITFNEPLDSATLNSSTITVLDSGTDLAITDLTFGYFTQTAADGSLQGVVQIISASNFGGASGLKVTLKGGVGAPAIADRTGFRSALFDYNQDGVADTGGDPFGTPLQSSQTFSVGAPSNDLFADAITIVGMPTQVHGSNVNATSEAGERVLGVGRTVWWKWTAPSSGPVSISTAGSGFDTILGVYTLPAPSTTVNSLILAQSNDNFIGLTSQVNFNAVAGTIYYIQVDGVGFNNSGDVTLSITQAAPPANDNFANAFTINGLAVSASGYNFNATSETGEPAHDGVGGGHSAWWNWTLAGSSPVYVSISTVGSDFTTALGVYTGSSVNALTTVASNHAILGTGTQVSFLATPGVTYHIAVDGVGAAEGNIQLAISTTPANDNFANATTLTGNLPITVTGFNLDATQQAGEPNPLGLGSGHTVWWKWTAPSAGNVTITTAGTGTTFNTVLGVFTGTGINNLVLVTHGANDDYTGTASQVIFNATGNTTYYIEVDGNVNGPGASSGGIQLSVIQTPVPANDNIANATTSDFTLVGSTVSTVGYNENATAEAGEPPAAGVGGGHSVWWSWTATTSGTVTINTVGSEFETALAVYTSGTNPPTVTSLTEIASNIDFSGTTSQVTFNATAGVTYFIVVDGVGAVTGQIVLNLNFTP